MALNLTGIVAGNGSRGLNDMGFADQVSAFTRKTEAKIEIAIRKIALDVGSAFVLVRKMI